MTADLLAQELQRLLDKAQRSLLAARELLQSGNPDFAASRAYYAAFYAIQALLLSRRLTFSSHGATLAAFHKEFLKTNLLPRRLGKAIDRLYRDRQVGDYEAVVSISEERAKEDIDLCDDLVSEARALLKKEGFSIT